MCIRDRYKSYWKNYCKNKCKYFINHFDDFDNLVLNKKVFIKRINTDRYGRTVAEIFIDDINIQKLLVNNGYAKVFEKYAYQCDWTKS